MTIPKLWSVQYVNSDGSKRFARESQKEGCFHVVGSTDPVGDLNNADAIVVAEGYATAATLRSLHAETGDPQRMLRVLADLPFRHAGILAWRRTMIGRWKAKSLVAIQVSSRASRRPPQTER